MSSILLALLPIPSSRDSAFVRFRAGAPVSCSLAVACLSRYRLYLVSTLRSCFFQAISIRKQGLSAGAGGAPAASQCYKYLRRPQPGPGMNCKNEDRWSSRTAEKWKARAPVTAEDTRKAREDQEKNWGGGRRPPGPGFMPQKC